MHAQLHRSRRACPWLRAHLLSFICYRYPSFHPRSAHRGSPYPGTGEVYPARPDGNRGERFSIGGGEVLPTGAEAVLSGRADLALVLGTSGGGWEGRASKTNVDWLRGRREAGSGRGAGLTGPFKALTSRGGPSTPLLLPPAPEPRPWTRRIRPALAQLNT